MSVSTRQSTKTAASEPGNTNTTSPQPSLATTEAANQTTFDAELHSMFNNLLQRVEQIANEVTKLKQKPGEDVTTDAHPIAAEEPVPMEDTPSPIVGEPTTRTEEQRLRSLYSKFAPSKITPRFAEQSIDQLESWLDINKIFNDYDRFHLLKMSIEPETYKQVSTALSTKHPGKEYESLKTRSSRLSRTRRTKLTQRRQARRPQTFTTPRRNEWTIQRTKRQDFREALLEPPTWKRQRNLGQYDQ